MHPWASPLFAIFSHHPLNKKIFAQNIYTINIDHILLSNLFDSSQKCLFEFFFLPLFFKSSNLILNFFTLFAIFDLIRQFVPKIY